MLYLTHTHTLSSSLSLFFYLSVCLSVCLSACLPACLPARPPIHPSIHPSIYLSIYLYMPSIRPSFPYIYTLEQTHTDRTEHSCHLKDFRRSGNSIKRVLLMIAFVERWPSYLRHVYDAIAAKTARREKDTSLKTLLRKVQRRYWKFLSRLSFIFSVMNIVFGAISKTGSHLFR